MSIKNIRYTEEELEKHTLKECIEMWKEYSASEYELLNKTGKRSKYFRENLNAFMNAITSKDTRKSKPIEEVVNNWDENV